MKILKWPAVIDGDGGNNFSVSFRYLANKKTFWAWLTIVFIRVFTLAICQLKQDDRVV
jgi:hypothetical protein